MSRLPDPFPPAWASAFGDDRFGLWAELTFNGVTQRLRWIAPGSFLMGAPEGEIDAFDREKPQHRVTLTRGYWLADTACTQAFWLAVVGGENPSEFKDESLCPVESVSWEDIDQRFLPVLQAALTDADRVELPTEAQWEYACRAGTLTPFNLGANITPEQVNYDGNHPYAGGKKGLYRVRTLPVCNLPPNDWGLYEMHGNVWEWCRDAGRRYGAEGVVDPEGPPSEDRALRGGSWFRGARRARSAYRYASLVGRRDALIGFRWSLRSMSQDQ